MTICIGLWFGLVLIPAATAAGPASDAWPSPAKVAVANTRQQQAEAGLPVRLEIPKIHVDTALDHVGIAPNGELGVPEGPINAAWYDRGPRPGQVGNAVIDGHFDWVNGKPAVFSNLHRLSVGDDVYVVDEKGATIRFMVSELKTYAQNQDDSDVFIPNDHASHLNLITCAGAWDKVSRSYSERLVVSADVVN